MRFEHVKQLYDLKLMKGSKLSTYLSADEGLQLIRKGGFAFQVSINISQSMLNIFNK